MKRELRSRQRGRFATKKVNCHCITTNVDYYNLPKTVLPEYLTDKVAIITFHFNPAGFKNAVDTYYKWYPSVSNIPVICLEMVLDGREQEIENSVVLHATPDNIMWQKERMINIAIDMLPDSVEYVAWVDHDALFDNTNWLIESIDKIGGSDKVIQPFSHIHYLNENGRYERDNLSASYKLSLGKYPDTGPGLAWVARKDTMQKIGGLYDKNIVGGGDAAWFYVVTEQRIAFLDRQTDYVQYSVKNWKDKVGGVLSYDYVAGTVHHIWHGDNGNRQYISRDQILIDNDFNPYKDIEIDPNNGLNRFCSDKLGLHKHIKEYFINRKEDG